MQVVAATAEGQYVLTRPAAAYKKVFAPLAEKAAICFEVGWLGAWLGWQCVSGWVGAWTPCHMCSGCSAAPPD